MNRPSSSTSSSEPKSWRDALATAAWFVGFVVVFELTMLTLEHTPLADKLGYFAYGLSAETKLRALAADGQLPPRHVFNAGWLDLARFPPAGADCDLVIYGMSDAMELTQSIHDQRPELKLRELYGPGVPLSHSYAAYHLDVSRRRTQAVIIPLLSDGVVYLRTMTHDTLAPDHMQPVTWPRYALRDGHVELVGQPAITSADQLRTALLTDHALWARQLAVLEQHDDYFERPLYAAHWTEALASLRLIRRARSHSHTHDLRQELTNHAGFRPNTETAQLLRALLEQYITEVRGNGEQPIVVLFDSPGEAGWIEALVHDVLERTQVPTVRSQAFCDATHRENFTDDGHYSHACNQKIAAELIQLFERGRDRRLAADESERSQ